MNNKTLGRYRKVYVQMWEDQKFRSLSAPQPNAQSLWQYLLTSPLQNSIPGLFKASEVVLADELNWPMEGFREVFREVLDKGMLKVDWKAKLIWIPKAFFYNKPTSPNVIKSWVQHYAELPECDLKNEALQELKGFIDGMSKGFREAFDKAFGKTYRNQDQDQDQEIYTHIGKVEISKTKQPKKGNSKKNDTLMADEIVNALTHLGWKVQFSTEINRLDALTPIKADEFKQAKSETEQINKPNLKYFLDVIETIRKNPGKQKQQWIDNSDQARQDRTIDAMHGALKMLGLEYEQTGKNGLSSEDACRIIDLHQCDTDTGKTDPAGTGSEQLGCKRDEGSLSMVKKVFQA